MNDNPEDCIDTKVLDHPGTKYRVVIFDGREFVGFFTREEPSGYEDFPMLIFKVGPGLNHNIRSDEVQQVWTTTQAWRPLGYNDETRIY